jgi:hypothetical protein
MIAPSVQAAEIERHTGLPTGAGERFTGYGVMGLPFAFGLIPNNAVVHPHAVRGLGWPT